MYTEFALVSGIHGTMNVGVYTVIHRHLLRVLHLYVDICKFLMQNS